MEKLKDRMDLAEGLIYLNHASIGPLPKSSFDILHKENLKQMNVGEEKINYEEIDELWSNLRKNASSLLQGDPDGVAITTSTASGLHVIADCLYDQFRPGKNIVMPDVEFVTNNYCWQQVARRHDLEIRYVSMENEDDYYEQWERYVDDNTVLAILSHVQFSDGFRSDLRQISQISHEHGALVAVDAIQSLGAVPFDVKRFDVDFVAAAGYKFMLGPQSSGLLYVKPELVKNLQSTMVGWFSTPTYRDLGHHTFEPWNDARKFQLSMINPVYNALNQSLVEIISWGVDKTYNTVIALLDRLIKGIEDNDNFSVDSSLNPETRSCILKIDSKRDAGKIVTELGKRNITVAYREGGIRVSPHGYNDASDIDALIDVLVSWQKD